MKRKNIYLLAVIPAYIFCARSVCVYRTFTASPSFTSVPVIDSRIYIMLFAVSVLFALLYFSMRTKGKEKAVGALCLITAGIVGLSGVYFALPAYTAADRYLNIGKYRFDIQPASLRQIEYCRDNGIDTIAYIGLEDDEKTRRLAQQLEEYASGFPVAIKKCEITQGDDSRQALSGLGADSLPCIVIITRQDKGRVGIDIIPYSDSCISRLDRIVSKRAENKFYYTSF